MTSLTVILMAVTQTPLGYRNYAMYAYQKFFFIAARPDNLQFIMPWGQKYQLLEKLQMVLQMNDSIAAVLFTLTILTLVMSVVETMMNFMRFIIG